LSLPDTKFEAQGVPSSSDLKAASVEKILTFLDGPSLSQAIQSRNLVYEDETCKIWAWTLGDFIGIDTRIYDYEDTKLSTYKHWKYLRAILEEDLRAAGHKVYLTVVDDAVKFRWCEWWGFETTYVTLGEAELMIKEI